MSSLLERGREELGRARKLASEQLRTRIPGRRSRSVAAADRTATKARRATKGAEALGKRAHDWVQGAQRARERRRKRIAAATAAGAAGGAGAYLLSRKREPSEEAPAGPVPGQETQGVNGAREVKDPVTTS